MDISLFWITIISIICGVLALVITIFGSSKLKRIEAELRNPIDIIWDKPNQKGISICYVTGTQYSITEIRIKLKHDEWYIPHIEPNEVKTSFILISANK